MKLGRLKSLGVSEPWLVPLCCPAGINDYRHIMTDYEQVYKVSGQKVVVSGVLHKLPHSAWHNSTPTLTITLHDPQNLLLTIKLFGDMRELEASLVVGETYHFTGISFAAGPYLNLRAAELIDPSEVGTITPYYKGKSGVITPANTKKLIHKHLTETIALAEAKLRPMLVGIKSARKILKARSLNLTQSLYYLHFPDSVEQWDEARQVVKRLAALYCVRQLSDVSKSNEKPKVAALPNFDFEYLTSHIPFELTDEQRYISHQLCEQVKSGNLIRAILTGDVGTGKTVTYGLVAAACVASGGRAAIMLPSLTLAKQIFDEVMQYWPQSNPSFVTGDTGNVDNSPKQFYIGTSALLHRELGRLDLLIIDEQQRFGLKQREQLVAVDTHCIEVTATPIPRTQALINFGNIDLYRLTKCHSKKTITTKLRLKSEGAVLMAECLEQIALNNKVLVVCPVKEGETELITVEEVAKKWKKYAKNKVRYIHSGCDKAHNEESLEDVKTGKANILIATSIVEIGITIPNLTKVIIYHAERFSAISAHQIRGRLVRNGGQGQLDLYCPKPISDKSLARLQLVTKYTDGFELAEQDMFLRGFGDIGGKLDSKQHGDTESILIGEKIDLKDVEEILTELNN